jgi:hypothetical protein
VEPIVHFAIPFFALRLSGVELRKALPVSFFAVLPDLDALFLVHRSASHSLVVQFISMAPALLLAYRFRRGLLGPLTLAFLALASHPLLDMFSGYTPILWPLHSQSLWVQFSLTAHIGSGPSLMPRVGLLAKPVTFERLQGLDAPIFTGESLTASGILLISLFIGAFRGMLRHRPGKR